MCSEADPARQSGILSAVRCVVRPADDPSGRLLPGLLATALLLTAAGCATTSVPPPPSASVPPAATVQPVSPLPGATSLAPPSGSSGITKRPGGFYLDDGPGERDAAELARLAQRPDPEPKHEPLHPRANRPYRALGNDYQPMTRRMPFRQRGIASWYGKRYHGNATSIGERYDMYTLTAAHPTLPLPSYARVTNLDNGRSVIVRLNDRGPFLHDRAIDLSYLAAYKLDYLKAGSAPVEIELLDPTRPPPAATMILPVAYVAPVGGRAAAPLHFLQLGAYKGRDNAEAALQRLRTERETLAAPLAVVTEGGFYRVQAGPYVDRDLAEQAGSALAARTGFRSLLVSR